MGGRVKVTDCSNILFLLSHHNHIKMKFTGYILICGKKLWNKKIYKYHKNAERIKKVDEKRFEVKLKIVENFIKDGHKK